MYKIGVVGLGVMGANLARNIASKGFPVAGYDLNAAKTQAFAAGQPSGSGIGSADAPESLMALLERPRRVLMMVPAGAPVDSVIAHLRPHLERDDILIDGGNSFFRDTDRRADDLASAGFRFVGMGVSGGEEGALRGPSMMPGGPREAWEALAPILRAMAAKADDGDPCVSYMGPRGAGHYVKMVHNGIEYGDMQLIAEVYDVLTRAAGMSAREIADTFSAWNEGELRSYLVEITARVLERVDRETGKPLVELILDEAQQKGTGKWMSQNAFDVGAPIPTVNAAVEARLLSALKSERVVASKVLPGPSGAAGTSAGAPGTSVGAAGTSVGRDFSRADLIEATRRALYAAKITSYAQGMALLRQASQEYKYDIDLAEVARIWRAGCIIRAALLSDVREAFSRNAGLVNLMLDDSFSTALASGQQALRDVVQTAVAAGIPVPALGSSLAYYDSYRTARLPANLTQGQRDFFGAHTYRRLDRDGVFHTDWARE
jgi:6-phosphogluconate dehydrogenase